MSAAFERPRDVARRLVLTTTLELQSPTHLGGADPDASSERPLARSSDGRLLLSGTSLAGVLRAELEARFRDSPRAQEVVALFGGSAGDDQGTQSRLIVHDSHADAATELRDGVALDPQRSVADDGRKFDLELAPMGTTFEIRLSVVLPNRASVTRQVLQILLATILMIERGVRLGARTARGFGMVKGAGRWALEDYALAEPSGMLAWIGRGRTELPDGWPMPNKAKDLTVEALGTRLLATGASAILKDLRRELEGSGTTRIEAELRLIGSLLLRAPSRDPGGPDNVQLSRRRDEVDEAVISGTTLAGALRARCRRIVNTLKNTPGDPDRDPQLVEELFGSLKVKTGEAKAGRLRVEEMVLRGQKALRHTRVRIDPWTGGASDNLLFTEEPVFGGLATLSMELAPPRTKERPAEVEGGDAARALLLLALRDLGSGDLVLGGEGGIGRGRFQANGLRFAQCKGDVNEDLHMNAAGEVVSVPEKIASDFDALHRELKLEVEDA